MAQIPTTFPTVPPALVSYDYVDFSNGTGYDIYYGAKGSNGSLMTTTQANVYSEEITTQHTGEFATSYGAAKLDVDFDINFNLPKDIKGDILLNVPVGIMGLEAGASTFDWYVRGYAYHFNGGEIQIATATSEAFQVVSALGNGVIDTYEKVVLLKMNVASVKHFKKGDTLRITIQTFMRRGGVTGTGIIGIGHDPLNRNDFTWKQEDGTVISQIITDGNTTRLSIHVPFVIET